MMEPFLTKFRGRCSVSNILKAGNKRFDSLPGLDAYPTGICWLHSIALRPYGTQCSFYAGHVKKGDITDSIAHKVIGALQPGITEIMNKPPMSLLGKRKWRGPGQGGGTLNPPQMWLGFPVLSENEPGPEEGDENQVMGAPEKREAISGSLIDKLLNNPHTEIWREPRRYRLLAETSSFQGWGRRQGKERKG